MRDPVNTREAAAGFKAVLSCLAMCVVLVGLTMTTAQATENGGSTYPIGAETVLPGLTPAPGQTIFAEFNANYQANSLVNGQGHSVVPGFDLSVYAFAPKVTHTWGLSLLGGHLVTWGASPLVDERLVTPAGAQQKTGFGNPALGIDIAYNKGNWHWWYGLDMETPAPGFHKGDALNTGQHNFATAPVFAFTYLPGEGATELSSRIQYLVNYTDPATHYHSGNELIWEYVGMKKVTKKLSLGMNGYYHQQTTDDRLNSLVYENGNRVRDLTFGPEVRCHLGPMVLIGKYFRDTMVQNGARGNAYWVELAVPLNHPRKVSASAAPAPAPTPAPAPAPSTVSSSVAGGAGGSR